MSSRFEPLNRDADRSAGILPALRVKPSAITEFLLGVAAIRPHKADYKSALRFIGRVAEGRVRGWRTAATLFEPL